MAAVALTVPPCIQAQSAMPSASVSPASSDRTAHGQFRSNDEINGTHVEIYVAADDTATDSIIYTLVDLTVTLIRFSGMHHQHP